MCRCSCTSLSILIYYLKQGCRVAGEATIVSNCEDSTRSSADGRIGLLGLPSLVAYEGHIASEVNGNDPYRH